MNSADDFGSHLDAVLIGGQEHREIVVAPYDPRWPERFESQRRHLAEVLEDEVVAIHHIGSTAVPGLAAKPIVDIVLEVHQPEDEDTYVPRLEAVGYELRVREPGHRMFRTPARDVHIHCWTDPAEIERHLLFRDWLRHSEADRRLYQELKQRLAQRDWPDANYYARAKSGLVAEITERALAWDRTGRPPDPGSDASA